MSKVNKNRGGERITSEKWKAMAGVGVPMPEEGICDCGEPYHRHEKERVQHDNGYSFNYECP